MKNKKGFTLVEVLGVVVLIAIIFLISYTTVLNHLKSSQDKIDENTFSLLKSATKDYMNDNQDDYPEVNKNVFCIDVNTLIDNNYIDEDTVVSKDNKLLAKTMKVSYQDSNYNYELADSCKERKRTGILSAVQYLLEDANPKSVTSYVLGSDESHQMYAFDQPKTAKTPALTDYRYIGNDPYNYVEFSDEIWRIIGVFTVEDRGGNKSQTIKLIRNESIGKLRSFKDGVYTMTGFGGSTIYSDIYRGYYAYLRDDYKNMIKEAKYYLGDVPITCDIISGVNFPYLTPGNAEYYYRVERNGRAHYNNPSELNFEIALMYPSDYIYTYANGVDDICYNDGTSCYSIRGGKPQNSWLFSQEEEWTISTTGGSTFLYIGSGGNLTILYSNYSKKTARPVVYLKPNVKIVSGDGTKDNPYKFKI